MHGLITYMYNMYLLLDLLLEVLVICLYLLEVLLTVVHLDLEGSVILLQSFVVQLEVSNRVDQINTITTRREYVHIHVILNTATSTKSLDVYMHNYTVKPGPLEKRIPIIRAILCPHKGLQNYPRNEDTCTSYDWYNKIVVLTERYSVDSTILCVLPTHCSLCEEECPLVSKLSLLSSPPPPVA